MKIGILTFHSQLNYGGVLQCWALQTALEKMGHEVVVIDRWLTPDNWLLDRGTNKWNVRQWVKFWVRSLLGLGDLSAWRRIRRTKKFIDQCLNLTPYHFVEWGDAPKDLGVDLLVVGSDQVWHCGDFGDPRVYLLEDAPSIQAIAYAASFGMTEIPPYIFGNTREVDAVPIYERGLHRFKAVSCREAEGVRLCGEFDVKAEHVVDPTLLLEAPDWTPKIGHPQTNGVGKRLVCYFLSEDLSHALPILKKFAIKSGWTVEVLIDYGKRECLPFPSAPAKMRIWSREILEKHFGLVRITTAAGPIEFVKALSCCNAVVSDSFHALMFATVFEKNVRILRPQTKFRQKMFARIEEFAVHTKGPLVADNLQDALDSLGRNDQVTVDRHWLESRKNQSKDFLHRNVG